jgi:PKD repeat protein
MKTRRFVVLLVMTVMFSSLFLLPGCVRFDGVIDFEADVLSGRKPLPVQFTLRVQGCVGSCLWSFGDGTFSRERNPVHTYEQAGDYTVILTVTPCRGEPVSVRKDDYITVTSGFGSPPTRMWCYYGDDERGRICRSELVPPYEGKHSGANECLNHTIRVPHDFALLDATLFWTDQDRQKIYAADVTPGQPDNVASAVLCAARPYGLTIDPEALKLCWIEEDSRVMRANLDGSALEEFLFWSDRIDDLAFDSIGRNLYFVATEESGGVPRPQEEGPFSILSIGVDGGSAATIVNEWGAVITAIAIDQVDRKVYWYSEGDDVIFVAKIKRANLDGTDIETIVSDVPGVGDLAVDEQDRRIVWVSYVDGIAKLMSAALDGSDVRSRLMNTQTAKYTAIAIGPRPALVSADLSD